MARSTPWKKKPRHVNHTTLIVVEGETEETFVKYLRNVARNSGTRVTVKCARGNGDTVLKLAVHQSSGYDTTCCLYDLDRPPTKKNILTAAKRLKIQHLGTSPCLEGLFLSILDQPLPQFPNHLNLSDQCKRLMKSYTSDSLMEPATYPMLLPLSLLLSKRSSIQVLDELLKAFKL